MRAGSRKSLKVEEGSKDESSKKTVKKAASVVAKYKSSILTRTSLSSRVSEITLITSQRRLRSCENIVKGKKEVAPTRKHPIKTGDKSSPTTGAAVNRKVKDTITKNSDISRTISAKKVQAKREEVNIDHVPGGKSKNSKAATKYSDIAIQMTKKTEKSKSEPKTAKLEKFSRKDLSPARKHPIKNTEKTRASVKGETENSVASNPKKSRGMTVTAVQLRGKSRENNHAVASKSADVPTKQKKSSIAVQKTKKQVKMDLLKESSIKTRQKNVKVTAARKIENDMKSASMKNLILGIKPASAIKSSVNSLPPKKSPKKSVPMLNRTILKKLKGRPLTSTELKRLKRRPLTAAELKKLGPIVPRKQKPKEFEFKGSEWSGNSDDEGSVDFALLDEDLCYECGLDTSDEANWSKLIICDACDGEYHMACVKLDRVPRNGYCCPKCYQEEEEFSKLKFTVGDHFEVPRRKKGQILSRCYSPSRPLDVAFEECKRKGFMLVSQLFSYDLMRQMTHGLIHKLTSSGRVADSWEGATAEISKRLGNASHNLVDRQGRFDMRIPEFVVEKLKLTSVLEPLLCHLRSIMSVGKKVPELRTHNIVFVPVGSKEQIWHVDDCVRKKGLQHRYFTILVQLNMIDENCGGTEVWSKELVRGDLIRGRPGDAFVFPGSLLHRGRGNDGNSHRFFYYASFSSETDNNSY